MRNQVIPFLNKSVRMSKALNIFRLFTCLGAFLNISQFTVWPEFNNKWSPTSDVCLVEQCSLHLTPEFYFVSPTENSLHKQVPL